MPLSVTDEDKKFYIVDTRISTKRHRSPSVTPNSSLAAGDNEPPPTRDQCYTTFFGHGQILQNVFVII